MPRHQTSQPTIIFACLLSAAVLALPITGCTDKATPPPAAAPSVSVMTLVPHTTPLSVDIVGEIKSLQEVELRPRVSGLVMKQAFKPGQQVKAGDLLFLIDPRPYDEAVLNSRANLAEAEANLARVRQDVERYQPLLKDNAIPRQTYDQTLAQAQQTEAVVAARRAGLEQARLERSYAEIRSPITGQIGLQQIEVGGLVSAGQTVMATVSTRNPVVVYFNIPETDYLAFAKRMKSQAQVKKEEDALPIQLILADGSTYPQAGKFDFADRALNPATGTLSLRAIFPNPNDLLRPGLSARVRIVHQVAENAILVPQKAVTEMLGKYFASVVGSDNKVEQRPIQPGQRVGEMWVVESGLKGGETIIVDGLQKARPGMVVAPTPLPDGK